MPLDKIYRHQWVPVLALVVVVTRVNSFLNSATSISGPQTNSVIRHNLIYMHLLQHNLQQFLLLLWVSRCSRSSDNWVGFQFVSAIYVICGVITVRGKPNDSSHFSFERQNFLWWRHFETNSDRLFRMFFILAFMIARFSFKHMLHRLAPPECRRSISGLTNLFAWKVPSFLLGHKRFLIGQKRGMLTTRKMPNN